MGKDSTSDNTDVYHTDVVYESVGLPITEVTFYKR
jgi:hypothetical protein